jgi:hypothetical protein
MTLSAEPVSIAPLPPSRIHGPIVLLSRGLCACATCCRLLDAWGWVTEPCIPIPLSERTVFACRLCGRAVVFPATAPDLPILRVKGTCCASCREDGAA